MAENGRRRSEGGTRKHKTDALTKSKGTQRDASTRSALNRSSTRQSANQKVSKRERSLQRRRDPSNRSAEAALQNEIAKSVRRAVKRLLRREEEEILRLLSPMEQMLVEELSQGINATVTIADLMNNLKKARAKSGSKANASADRPAQAAQGAEQNQVAGETTPQGAKNDIDRQPSKSLDLVTDRVDDDDNNNSYEAAL